MVILKILILGYEVSTLDDVAHRANIVVTTTGCKDIIVGKHMEVGLWKFWYPEIHSLNAHRWEGRFLLIQIWSWPFNFVEFLGSARWRDRVQRGSFRLRNRREVAQRERQEQGHCQTAGRNIIFSYSSSSNKFQEWFISNARSVLWFRCFLESEG